MWFIAPLLEQLITGEFVVNNQTVNFNIAEHALNRANRNSHMYDDNGVKQEYAVGVFAVRGKNK